MSKKPKDNEQLPADIANNINTIIIQTLQESFNTSKRRVIYLAYLMGIPNRTIADCLSCGIKYVNQSVSVLRKCKNAQAWAGKKLASLPDWYRSQARNKLPVVVEIERRALDHLVANPEKVVEKPAAISLLRQIKRSAGVDPDPEEGPSVVNIQEVRNLMIQMMPGPEKIPKLAPEAITVTEEPVEEEE